MTEFELKINYLLALLGIELALLDKIGMISIFIKIPDYENIYFHRGMFIINESMRLAVHFEVLLINLKNMLKNWNIEQNMFWVNFHLFYLHMSLDSLQYQFISVTLFY